jgi:hypothetical protein
MIEPGHPCVNDQRQGIFMFRTDVDEVNVQPIDLGDELRQGVEPRFHLPPVVFRSPIARERLDRRELYSLRCVRNRFPLRPLCRVDAPAQFGKFRFRNIHMKRTNRSCLPAAWLCSAGLAHAVFLLSSFESEPSVVSQ